MLLEMLDQESPDVQAIACEGVAKLMLSGIVADKMVSGTDRYSTVALVNELVRFFEAWSSSTYSLRRRIIKLCDNV